MRLPRDISGDELARAPASVGYTVTRERGSHMLLTTYEGGEPHVTVPRHHVLRVGTLAGILTDVATHLGMSREGLVARLFS